MQAGGIVDYLTKCDHPDSEIFSPAQAWNAITVGAMTEKDGNGGITQGSVLAETGDLAPVSRTASWKVTWPIKPDIVMEGGNWYEDNISDTPNSHPDLMLVSTSHQYPMRSFVNMGDTSAATALAAREIAILRSEYSDLWPETIRALYVGSARWTDRMWSHIPENRRHIKGEYELLFRRYGYGKPNLARAMSSASNAVTLIVQDEIRPYTNTHSGRKLNEMRVFDLPWPVEVLRGLGTQEVTLRISLSTFIAPNPSEVARGKKLRYGSHGLRFKLKGADESVMQFKQRVGRNAEAEDAQVDNAPDSGEWTFGSTRRDVGSLHIDTLTIKASDLARRGCIAVHPVGGWWKDSKKVDPTRCIARYALVVEIDTVGIEADIYTEIETHVAIPVAVPI